MDISAKSCCSKNAYPILYFTTKLLKLQIKTNTFSSVQYGLRSLFKTNKVSLHIEVENDNVILVYSTRIPKLSFQLSQQPLAFYPQILQKNKNETPSFN